MDSDFWSARIAAAKRQYALQHHNHISIFDRLSLNDYELEEEEEEMEIRQDFTCPYCYEDFDVVSLCSHIEDEHSSESRAIACPICSVKVTSDIISHITLQHGQLFKISFGANITSFIHMCYNIVCGVLHCHTELTFPLTENYLHRRRRLRRLAVPNNQALSVLGRDLREAHLQVLLGSGGYRQSNTITSTSNAAAPTDPFLSSLIMNFPTSEAEKEISKAVISSIDDTSSTIPEQPHQWKMSFDPSVSYEERQKRIKQAAGRAVFMQDLFLSTLLQD
ncbi:hypothetical protein QQ045_010428 [Rhodiola kirilowii]